MKNVLNYVPGFRSNKVWKKIIAIIYYLISLMFLTQSFGAFLICATLPFLIFGIIDTIRNKNKIAKVILLGSVIIFGLGLGLNNATSNKEIKVAAQNKVIAIQKAKTDAIDKVIANNKAIADKKIADAQAIVNKKAEAIKLIADNKIKAAKVISDAKIAANTAYQSWITNQFSVWDGSNTVLVNLVKQNLNDDTSFKHVSTTYVNHGSYLIVFMVYRAKNAFGAEILQNVTARSDYATNTITIISQNN